MKSFIRYLYEYQNGKRTRNTGFVKALEQTDTAEIQIYGRGFPVAGGRTLEIYLFYEEDGKCIGIRMGEIRGAQAAFGYKLSYTTDDVGGDGQFGRIGGMILRAGNGADAGYYGAVWDEARLVDVSRMITEEEWKLNKSGKNKKIANGGDVLSNEKYEKPGNEKILEEKTSQRKYENIEETLNATLITAQRAAEDTCNAANKKARIIVEEADLKARQVIEQANNSVIEIRKEYDLMVKEFKVFRNKFKSLLEDEIKSIDEIFYNVDENPSGFENTMMYNLQNEAAISSLD